MLAQVHVRGAERDLDLVPAPLPREQRPNQGSAEAQRNDDVPQLATCLLTDRQHTGVLAVAELCGEPDGGRSGECRGYWTAETSRRDAGAEQHAWDAHAKH